MTLVKSTKAEKNQYELEIAVDVESFNHALSDAYKKNIKKMNIPGFRRGKAPRSVVEKLYGEGVFFEDAISALYPESYEAAVKEAGIEPVDRAEIDIVSVNKQEGFVFKAKVTVKPEVKVGTYKNLNATKKTVQISDDDINEELNRYQQRNARMIPVEGRPAQNGDTCVFDFDGYVDGKPFEGGKAEKFSLQLGSGQFIPGFEEQMEGHSAEEEFDVNVSFPDTYHVPDLAGKPAVFKVKMHEIKMKELPLLDDELAKDVSEFDTLADFKEDIRKKLLESREKAADKETEEQLIDAVINTLEADIPDVMFEHRVDQMVQDFAYRLQMQGMEINKYLEYTGMDMASFRKTFREQAERQVKISLALEKIVSEENLSATEDELNAEFEKLAKQYEMEIEKIRNFISVEDITKDIAMNKAIDLIRDTAVVTETAEESEKKPAKPKTKKAAPKTAAKKTKKTEDTVENENTKSE